MRDPDRKPASLDLITQARRLAGRVARRIFRRQVAINRSVCDRLDAIERIAGTEDPRWQAVLARLDAVENRQDAVENRQDAVESRADLVLALGWDHAALVRRLCWLEDQLLAQTGRAVAPEHPGDASRAA